MHPVILHFLNQPKLIFIRKKGKPDNAIHVVIDNVTACHADKSDVLESGKYDVVPEPCHPCGNCASRIAHRIFDDLLTHNHNLPYETINFLVNAAGTNDFDDMEYLDTDIQNMYQQIEDAKKLMSFLIDNGLSNEK